jgi:single-strand DNA-binding protein
MANLNKVMIIGNVGTDPEMRFTPNGNPVTSFRVATSRTFQQDGQRKQETEWFTVTTWNKLAESCNQYLSKGKRVYVEGRLRSRTWEGQDGTKRTQIEIVAERVLFLDRQATKGGPEMEGAATTPAAVDEPEGAEDLPF